MRTILLAAGLGTRLRPLTDNTPKCLLPVNGKPLLQIWLERLSQSNYGPFLVNTHYLSDQVEQFALQSEFKDRITISHEPTLLGTAATLIHSVDFFEGEDGLLLHADNYCTADLAQFSAAHKCRPTGCEITMMIFRSDNPSACGIVELDERGVVTSFHEKVPDPPGNLANGAIYILSRAALVEIAEGLAEARDFSTEILPRFIGRIYAFHAQGIFIDIGTPKSYSLANS